MLRRHEINGLGHRFCPVRFLNHGKYLPIDSCGSHSCGPHGVRVDGDKGRRRSFKSAMSLISLASFFPGLLLRLPHFSFQASVDFRASFRGLWWLLSVFLLPEPLSASVPCQGDMWQSTLPSCLYGYRSNKNPIVCSCEPSRSLLLDSVVTGDAKS